MPNGNQKYRKVAIAATATLLAFAAVTGFAIAQDDAGNLAEEAAPDADQLAQNGELQAEVEATENGGEYGENGGSALTEALVLGAFDEEHSVFESEGEFYSGQRIALSEEPEVLSERPLVERCSVYTSADESLVTPVTGDDIGLIGEQDVVTERTVIGATSLGDSVVRECVVSAEDGFAEEEEGLVGEDESLATGLTSDDLGSGFDTGLPAEQDVLGQETAGFEGGQGEFESGDQESPASELIAP